MMLHERAGRNPGNSENTPSPSPASPAGLTRSLRDIGMLAAKGGQTGAAAVADEAADLIEALADRLLSLESAVLHLRNPEVGS